MVNRHSNIIKNTICFLLILVSVFAHGQSNPSGFPSQNIAGWITNDYTVPRLGTIVPVNTPSFTPRFPGTTILRQQNGVDTAIYYWTGGRWIKMISGTDTTSLSNRINLKLNIVDTTNKWWGLGKRWVDTVYRVNDSTIGFTVNGGSQQTFEIKGTGGGGSGGATNNVNIGSGFRPVNEITQEMRTYFASFGIKIDTVTNASGITWRVDTTRTTGLPSYFYVDSLVSTTAGDAFIRGSFTNMQVGYASEVDTLEGEDAFRYNDTTNTLSVVHVKVGDGSEGASSMSFTNYPQSGMSHDADGLKINEAGTKAMDIRSSDIYFNRHLLSLMGSNLGSYSNPFSQLFISIVRPQPGSAATPSYNFDDGLGNLTNSGMFSASNVLGFSVAGSEKMRLSGGELMVNTTTDQGAFTIQNNGGFWQNGAVSINLGSDATGDVYYRNAGGAFTRLPIGSSGDVLTVASGIPSWATPSASGISTLNTLTASTQTFATGTSGTDFNISSSTSTHTFHIPSASISNRGLITTSAQTLGGQKTFNDGIVATSVLNPRVTINGNVSASIGPGTYGDGLVIDLFTHTNTGAAGTISTSQNFNFIGSPTLTSTNAISYTGDVATIRFVGAPIPSGSTTISHPWNILANDVSYLAGLAMSLNEQSGDVTIANASGVNVYTGAGGNTWTLPSLATHPGKFIFIKNAGGGNLTVQRTGSDNIYNTSSVTSITIAAGADVVLAAGSSFWYVLGM